MLNVIKRNLSKLRHGMSCIFIPVSPTIGIKLYWTIEERDFAFTTQKRAYRAGIAPRAYRRVSIRNQAIIRDILRARYVHHDDYFSETSIMYGYTTRRAKMIHNIPHSDLVPLIDKMEALKLKTSDVWSENVGKIGDKLVCIDFDEISVGRH